MSLPNASLPKAGDVVAGKYRIEKVLGKGGMGVVVAAQHTTLRQKVAIKFLLPAATKNKDASERFLREAQAAVFIQSEHVARVTDVGTLDDGTPYMVMELLTGGDLGALLAEKRTLPVAEVVDDVLQACEALAEAHSLGIIHRDLKPANLFLTHRADGSSLVKVLDFGLSKVAKPDPSNPSLTADGFVMGSPPYMSPEQLRSLKGLDARTDIWALGVILYQLLAGVRPFVSPTLVELFFAIGGEAPKPLRAHRPDVPPELEAAVLKCLEKDPSRRHQSVAELARAIAPFGNEESRISVDRIHRVLSDATPLPRGSMASLAAIPHKADEIASLSVDVADLEPDDVDDATVRQGLMTGKDGTVRILPAALPARPAPPAPPPPAPSASSPAPIPTPMPAPSAVVDQVKSGSMAAVARDGSMPTPSQPPARSRTGMVVAMLGVAVVVVGGLAAFGVSRARGQAPANPTGTAAASAAEPPAPTATAEATVAPSATATAEAAPSVSASKPPVPRKLGPLPKKHRW